MAQLIRRDGIGTKGGTTILTQLGAGSHDLNDLTPTTVVYTVGTANMSALGNSLGIVGCRRFQTDTSGVSWDFSRGNDKPIVLRNGGVIALSLLAISAPAGLTLAAEIEIEEDST